MVLAGNIPLLNFIKDVRRENSAFYAYGGKFHNLLKVLTKLVSDRDLKIRVRIESKLKEDLADQQVEETKAALRGLGLDDNIETQ